MNLSFFSVELGAASLLFLAETAFIAGLARGFSGFGGALIFSPVASAVINPILVAPALLIIDSFSSSALIPSAWKNANKKEVAIMASGAILGIPAGTWILTHTEPAAVRWIIVCAIIPALLFLVSGWRYNGQPKTSLTVGVGSLSGFLSGLAQIGGPPVVLYWLGGRGQSENVRANFILFFACTTIVNVIAYTAGGLFTSDVMWLSIFIFPAYGFGMWLGSRMFGWAEEKTFRNICYILIAVAALIGLPVFGKVFRYLLGSSGLDILS